MARNFLITMVPVVAQGMVLRSAAFVVLTATHAFGEAWYQPWLSLMNNVVEIVMSLALIIMSLGSLTGRGEGTTASSGLVTICFCFVWALFFVASVMTLVGYNLKHVKQRASMQATALSTKMALVCAKLSVQETELRSRRDALVTNLAWYDRATVAHALRIIEEELLDDSKSQYSRVRFSFLMSKSRSSVTENDTKVGAAAAETDDTVHV